MINILSLEISTYQYLNLNLHAVSVTNERAMSCWRFDSSDDMPMSLGRCEVLDMSVTLRVLGLCEHEISDGKRSLVFMASWETR
jgi:hypothetical protein